jgi:2,4-dienoyl-CoA reductase-like NADH-dependent reductase (Old Yellow Enzyme family)
MSPISNQRSDRYGGSFDNRIRLLLEIVDSIRAVWSEAKPLFVRISATDWAEGGWGVSDSVETARRLRDRNVDLIDCSSGGTIPSAVIPVGPGYQVEFADRVRNEAGLATAAVGLITDPEQANSIIASGKADAVFLGREILRQPNWPLLAANSLSQPADWPKQFRSARPRIS